MTLAMMQIGAGISALLVRGQIAYAVPPLVTTLGSVSVSGVPLIVLLLGLFLLVAHLTSRAPSRPSSSRSCGRARRSSWSGRG